MIKRLVYRLAIRLRILADPEENEYYAWADLRLLELEALSLR